MVVEYEKDYLEELYNDGKCKNKKYRFQKLIVTICTVTDITNHYQ